VKTFIDIISDLGVWGFLFTVIAAIAALYQIRQNRRKKTLSYEVLSTNVASLSIRKAQQ